MSQFLRKLCILFQQDTSKKEAPPSKTSRPPSQKTAPAKKNQACSMPRDLSSRPTKKQHEKKREVPVLEEEPMCQLKLLRMRKHFRETEGHDMQWGYVVGYINQGNCPANLLKQPQMRLIIGPEG